MLISSSLLITIFFAVSLQHSFTGELFEIPVQEIRQFQDERLPLLDKISASDLKTEFERVNKGINSGVKALYSPLDVFISNLPNETESSKWTDARTHFCSDQNGLHQKAFQRDANDLGDLIENHGGYRNGSARDLVNIYYTTSIVRIGHANACLKNVCEGASTRNIESALRWMAIKKEGRSYRPRSRTGEGVTWIRGNVIYRSEVREYLNALFKQCWLQVSDGVHLARVALDTHKKKVYPEVEKSQVDAKKPRKDEAGGVH